MLSENQHLHVIVSVTVMEIFLQVGLPFLATFFAPLDLQFMGCTELCFLIAQIMVVFNLNCRRQWLQLVTGAELPQCKMRNINGSQVPCKLFSFSLGEEHSIRGSTFIIWRTKCLVSSICTTNLAVMVEVGATIQAKGG